MTAQPKLAYEQLADDDLARLAAAHDEAAVALITSRNNRRLYRAAWGILKNHADAEDAVQNTYLKAFRAIGEFQARSSLSTWLTRIAINEALSRKREAERWWSRLAADCVINIDHCRERLMRGSIHLSQPDAELAREQIRKLLQQAIARLPERFRIVFVLRDVEEMSVQEVSEVLQIPAATVKTRLHRARKRLQEALSPELKAILAETLPFAGSRCAGLTDRLLQALREQRPHAGTASGSNPALEPPDGNSDQSREL